MSSGSHGRVTYRTASVTPTVLYSTRQPLLPQMSEAAYASLSVPASTRPCDLSLLVASLALRRLPSRPRNRRPSRAPAHVGVRRWRRRRSTARTRSKPRASSCRSSPAIGCAPTRGRVEICSLTDRARPRRDIRRSICCRRPLLRLIAGRVMLTVAGAGDPSARGALSDRHAGRLRAHRRSRRIPASPSLDGRDGRDRAGRRPRLARSWPPTAARSLVRAGERTLASDERRPVRPAGVQLRPLRRVRSLGRRRGATRAWRRPQRIPAARSADVRRHARSLRRVADTSAVRLRLVSRRSTPAGGRTTTATGRRCRPTAGRGSASTAGPGRRITTGAGVMRRALVLDS